MPSPPQCLQGVLRNTYSPTVCAPFPLYPVPLHHAQVRSSPPPPPLQEPISASIAITTIAITHPFFLFSIPFNLSIYKKCAAEAAHRKMHRSDCCDTTPDTQESMLKRACIFTKVKMHTSLSCQTYRVVSHKYFITLFSWLQYENCICPAARP